LVYTEGVTRALLALALPALAVGTWPAGAAASPARAVVIEHVELDGQPAEGFADALVTFELFLAPGDGARSARAYRLVQELLRQHPESVSVRYRLVGRSGHSDVHAEAAREAHAQGRLPTYLREAYRTGRSPRQDELAAVAERAGLDLARFQRALEEGHHAPAVRADHDARRRLRVSRVPGLLVGGVPFEEPLRSLEALEEARGLAEAHARTLRARGVPTAELYARILREVERAQPEPRIGDGLVDGKPPDERREASGPPRYVGASIDLRGAPARGPDDAPIAVVLYCTFASRYCAQMVQHTEALRHAFPDEVRLVFKHLIAEGVDREAARRLHGASLCAAEQQAFWEFHDWLLTRSGPDPSDEALRRAAEAAGLDDDELLRCADEPRIAASLEAELAEAARAGIEHTPSVVIAGNLYTGTKTFAELRDLVARELAPGLLERATALPPMR
jgi:protein-disulfide isomerase